MIDLTLSNKLNWLVVHDRLCVAHRDHMMFVMEYCRYESKRNRWNLVVLQQILEHKTFLARACPPGMCRRLAQEYCDRSAL